MTLSRMTFSNIKTMQNDALKYDKSRKKLQNDAQQID